MSIISEQLKYTLEKYENNTINPSKKLNHSIIKTFDDHRIAMAFAIEGLMTSKKKL